jgi:hypothetical protein
MSSIALLFFSNIFSFTIMKNKLFYTAAIFTLFFSVVGCKSKSCEGIVCGVNQQCAQGKCYCADGYEGDNCTTEAYTKYIKGYFVQENCQGGPSPAPQNSTVTITQGLFINRLNINNFLGAGIIIQGIIRTDQANRGNSIEIPRQNSAGVQVEGFGTLNPANGRITFELNYNYGGVNYSCIQTFYPQ